ncbi:MAG: DNA primase [Clostridiales bacterium]|nr:DNA primase [Clostridiales bacterium]
MYEKIPNELKQLPNWVCWKLVPDDSSSKPRKLPFDPRSGKAAASNNPATWCDFNTAVNASGYTGIGFMFSNSPYFGVDIDNVANELPRYMDGEPCMLLEFVDTLGSYTEMSTSGTGIHIICRGKLPAGGRRRGNVEMYEEGRFFVMTGRSVSQYTDIADCTEPIKFLHEQYIARGETPGPIVKDCARKLDSSLLIKHSSYSIDEILEAAFKSKSGEKFARLWHGDISGYTSHSEADLALCNMLAYWCQCDLDKMEAMFRQSGLMRDKWDRQQSGSTYGILTLQKAISECRNVYEPKVDYNISIGTVEPDGEDIVCVRCYSFDDMGNTQRMYDLFSGWLRYNYIDKRWLYYDTRRWQVDNRGEVERAAEKSIECMDAEAMLYGNGDPESDEQKLFQKWRKQSRSNKAKKAMLDELKHKVPILPRDMDKDQTLVNVMNGYVDLNDGKLYPHDAEKYMTRLAPVEYDPDAKCPVWNEFLSTVFAGDADLIRYVQKSVGYSLSGLTIEQCVFFLYGSGSNGKSTFLSTVRSVCGDYAANIQPETIMVKSNSNNANSDIARLKSARLVTSVEPNEGMRINEGLIKQLSGEDPVTARKLYGDEFEFMPEFKLWMATNHKPIIRGTDTGIWRRVHMIPFEVQIPDEKKDKHLAGKLRRELDGIFAWAVEGYRLYQRDGLKMPEAVYKAVAEYRHEMDVISLFIEDCCEAGGEVPAQVLYNAYKDWARAGEQHIHTSTKFGIEMAKRYAKVKGRNGIMYHGIHLQA